MSLSRQNSINPSSVRQVNINFTDLVVLTVTEARNLKSTRNEPFYLRVWTSSTRDNKLRTKPHVDGAVGALWNETFQMGVSNVHDEFMFIEVKSQSENVIGRVKVSCSEINREASQLWLQIYNDNNEEAGEVEVIISLKPYFKPQYETTSKSNFLCCSFF